MSQTKKLAVVMVLALAMLVVAPASVADEGKDLFVAQKCNMCHSVSSAEIEAKVKSEKMMGPDLTGVVTADNSETLAKFVKKQAQIDGKDHKKEFAGTDDELTAIIAWLETQK